METELSDEEFALVLMLLPDCRYYLHRDYPKGTEFYNRYDRVTSEPKLVVRVFEKYPTLIIIGTTPLDSFDSLVKFIMKDESGIHMIDGNAQCAQVKKEIASEYI